MDQFKMVAFEISNRCNYSHLHLKCPTNPNVTPIILRTSIIERVLLCLGSGYKGRIYFSIYNEPLIDPRFFFLLSMAKMICPGCTIELFTNGWNLDQNMLDELISYGVDEFKISAYSVEEGLRLTSLDIPTEIDYLVTPVCLDDRMGIYKRPENETGPCFGPSIYLFINHKGEVALCCFDYLYTCTFGNLYEQTIETILESDKRKEICESLKRGEKLIPVCKKCNSQSFFNEERSW